MSQRYLGWVGAILLLPLAASTACGARDTLYVLDDFGGSGGANAFAGSLNLGGFAGTFGNAGSGFAGTSIAGTGFVGTAGFGGGSSAFGGSSSAFGGGQAFGGSNAFGGGSQAFGGSSSFGGGVVGGAAGAIGTAGTTGFSCAQCLAQSANSCLIPSCDLAHETCRLTVQLDGTVCGSNSNLCQPNNVCLGGKCVPQTPIACPPSTAQCSQSECDPMTGQCINQPLTGPACDDSDPCTTSQCVNGMCVAETHTVACQSNDKCCPAGCTSNNDNDCTVTTRQITLNATDRGWYDNTGFHDTRIKNTFTGVAPPTFYNSFFVFDLSAVTGTIVGAQLLLTEENFYGSSKQTVAIWDVSETGSAVSMTSQSLVIYNDLQGGNQYGSFVGTAQAIGTTLSTILNAKAVVDLNAARGSTFSIGMHDSTLSGQTTDNEGIRFSEGTEQLTDELVLTVQ